MNQSKPKFIAGGQIFHPQCKNGDFRFLKSRANAAESIEIGLLYVKLLLRSALLAGVKSEIGAKTGATVVYGDRQDHFDPYNSTQSVLSVSKPSMKDCLASKNEYLTTAPLRVSGSNAGSKQVVTIAPLS